jgi:hypothetical protein
MAGPATGRAWVATTALSAAALQIKRGFLAEIQLKYSAFASAKA